MSILRYREDSTTLDGGLVTARDSALIANNESPDILNMTLERNTARKRNGSRKVNSTAIPPGALIFSGVSGYVHIPEPNALGSTALEIGGDITIEFSFIFDQNSGSAELLLTKSENNTTNESWKIMKILNGGQQRLSITFRDDTGPATRRTHTPAINLTAGVRYHVAWLFDQDTGGGIASSRVIVTNLTTGANVGDESINPGSGGVARKTAAGVPIIIGAERAQTNGAGFEGLVDFRAGDPIRVPFKGTMDEVRIWNTLVSTTDLATFRNRELDTTHPAKSNLRGYWKLNDRSNFSVFDSTLLINTSGTPSSRSDGALFPRRPTFQDGLRPDEQGKCIRLNGLDQYATIPVETAARSFSGPTDITSTGSATSSGRTLRDGYSFAFGKNPIVDIVANWTIEFSFRLIGTTAVSQTLFDWRTNATANNNILTVRTSGSRFIECLVSIQNAADINDTTITVTDARVGFEINLNQTYHVAVRRDINTTPETVITLFLDGVPVAAGTVTSGTRLYGPDWGLVVATAGAHDAFFGRRDDNSAWSNVEIDEVRVWTAPQEIGSIGANAITTRTDAQILQYYDKTLPVKEINTLDTNPTGVSSVNAGQRMLIHYWKLDDNHRDYSDAINSTAGLTPDAETETNTATNVACEDIGLTRQLDVAGTKYILGTLSLWLNPGTRIPEWAPGLLFGELQGGLVDGIRTFKKSDNSQSLVIAGEGALFTAPTSIPGALTTIKASGFQAGKQPGTAVTGDRLYLSNGLSPPLAFDGTTVRRWGTPGPTKQPVINRSTTSGSTAGDVQYVYTYVSRVNGLESNPSAPSPIIRDEMSLNAFDIAFYFSTDPQVDTIRIYRTRRGATTGLPQPGSAEFFFVDEISSSTAFANPDIPVIYKDNVSDGNLGFALRTETIVGAGGVVSTTAVAGPPPWCQYLAFFNGIMFMAGDPRDTKTRSRLFISRSLLPEEFSVNGFIDVESGEGEPITGLQVLFDRLFIFKRSTVYVLSGTGFDNFQVQILSNGVGAFSHFAMIPVDGVLYYLSDRGPYRTNGTSFEWIGQPILDTFQSLDKNQFSQAVAGHVKDRHQVWFGVPSTSGSMIDTILVFDYFRSSWTKFTGLHAQCMDSSIDSSGVNRILFGDDFGFVWSGDLAASFMDGLLGFAGTVEATLTAASTVGGLASGLVTVTAGAATFHTTDGDNLKGVRYEIEQAVTGLTAEGRVLLNTATVLTLDKTAAQLGFTPASGDTVRLMAIDGYVTTKPFDMREATLLKRVEEVELEGQAALDSGATGTTVTLTFQDAIDFGSFGNTQVRSGSVGGAGQSSNDWIRFNVPRRPHRFQVKIANDRCNERFEIRTLTIRSVSEGRT